MHFMQKDFLVTKLASSTPMFNAAVKLWSKQYIDDMTDTVLKEFALTMFKSFLKEGAELRNFYMGASNSFATLTMNNCGLEERNKSLKEFTGVKKETGAFMSKAFQWVLSEGLRRQDNPDNPNQIKFAMVPTIYSITDVGRVSTYGQKFHP